MNVIASTESIEQCSFFVPFPSLSYRTLKNKNTPPANPIANSLQTQPVRRRNPTSTLLPTPRILPHPTKQLLTGQTSFPNRAFVTATPNILRIPTPTTNIPEPSHKPSLPPPIPTRQRNPRKRAIHIQRRPPPDYPDYLDNTPSTYVACEQ